MQKLAQPWKPQQTFVQNSSISPRKQERGFWEIFNDSQLTRWLNESKTDEMTITMCDNYIEEIKQLERQKEEALYLKAISLAKIKWFDEALDSFAYILKMNSEDKMKMADVHFQIGMIHMQRQEFQKAIDSFT